MKSFYLLSFVLLMGFSIRAQEAIKITDSIDKNRLLIYATNQTLTDLDILLTLDGSGFRQRAGAPRRMHIPARAKVNVLSLVIERGKTPYYDYHVETFEELAARSLKFEIIELVKVKPPAPIHLIFPDTCTNCEELLAQMNEGPYDFFQRSLSDNEDMKTQLAPAFIGTTYDIDTIDTAIVMIGGKVFPQLQTYEEIIAKINELYPAP